MLDVLTECLLRFKGLDFHSYAKLAVFVCLHTFLAALLQSICLSVLAAVSKASL